MSNISNEYAGALEDYLASESEAALHSAYELGRKTVTAGFGVLDMAHVHLQASFAVVRPVSNPEGVGRQARAVENFFMEALSPFEAHHRGFQDASTRLSELSGQVLQAHEQERQRISRELHDEVGQALTVANMNLELIKRKTAGFGHRIVTSLEEIQGLLVQTMENVRRFSHELRPPMLDDLGLVAALRACLRVYTRRTSVKTTFRADPAAELLPDDAKIVIYRVLQESLTNASKHAAASKVNVRLCRTASGFRLTVKDNGVGFQTNQSGTGCRQKDGIGLVGMQERLRLVKGTLAVQSEPGKGTAIRATLPFVRPKTDHCPLS